MDGLDPVEYTDRRQTGCGHIVVVEKSGNYTCKSCNRNVEIDKRYVIVQAYDPDGTVYLMSS